jgi:CRISPR-associated protein Csx17
MEPLYLYGCRHDILGHYLKAFGLLRVLASCADKERCDPEAEGWWDLERGCFRLRSLKYPTAGDLMKFFAEYYRPTAVFAAWNKEPGIIESRARRLGHGDYWKIAEAFSKQVVSVEERKKPASQNKLISREAFNAYREEIADSISLAVDAISSPRFNGGDNPIFLSKGIAGRAHLWRTFWEYAVILQNLRTKKNRRGSDALVGASLFEGGGAGLESNKGKGTPFFPDAIKAYNIGSGWVTETYPFNALDYVLAVEGGFAMRGAVARTLGADSKRFAAFPFVFDSGEEMVDDANEVKGTSNALWFPQWNRPTTFAEFSSFISDAQARLPGKEVRFSAEFVRALNAQGVDAGFVGWQEFRFKMKISRVPWITTGRYVEAAFRLDGTRLNRALHPLDESRFLDQFAWKSSKIAARSPHPMLAEINDAMETATYEPTPPNCLNLLGSIFRTCRRMAISESLRDSLPGKRANFFPPLPMSDWSELFIGFDVPEFRIARALAAIQSNLRQRDGRVSKTLPMLGSILPLELAPTGWYLPKKGDSSNQAVWSGTDLCHDLAAVLSRRYLDSLTDERPALLSAYGARLADVLDFLRRELDDQLIASWTESLSLIGWSSSHAEETQLCSANDETAAIPPEYAALRTLIELECEAQPRKETKKRRSQRPISLPCQRSASVLPLAVAEALRWIGIWGVPNPYRSKVEPDKKRLAGRDIISLETAHLSFSIDATRLAAAVCIPLHWRDRNKLFRAVSLPQAD